MSTRNNPFLLKNKLYMHKIIRLLQEIKIPKIYSLNLHSNFIKLTLLKQTSIERLSNVGLEMKISLKYWLEAPTNHVNFKKPKFNSSKNCFLIFFLVYYIGLVQYCEGMADWITQYPLQILSSHL